MCVFDKITTSQIIVFEVFTITAAILLLIMFHKYDKKIFTKFGVMMIGIFIFEFFTHPMWMNYKLGEWAYVYRDVSWILTVGWSMIFLTSVFLIDQYLPKVAEWKRFFLYIISITILGVLGESLMISLGVRSYSPEVQAVIANRYTPLMNVPMTLFYYVPIFGALVIGFYKYWSYSIEGTPLLPVKKKKLFRSFIIAFVGVFLFEMMIEPMVVNQGFPSWSYIYRDVSFILTGGWVILIWAVIWFVDKFLRNLNLFEKFITYVFAIGVVTVPFEFLLITNGFREYGPSSVANFSGLVIPMTSIPIEIMFAIPFYLSLVIGFIKYWEYMMENSKINI